jgi:hypothetical protein
VVTDITRLSYILLAEFPVCTPRAFSIPRALSRWATACLPPSVPRALFASFTCKNDASHLTKLNVLFINRQGRSIPCGFPP